MNNIRYVSLFSGVEAASLAFEPLGWEPVAFCEIEPFPSAVLEKRFPDVPNLGDVTKVDWEEFSNERGAVDLLVGGSPCQSFSIAGGRESLDGESRLMFEYIRAVRELSPRPRWILWENVPGCLSAKGLEGDKGGAFRQLLSELCDLGYSLCWRVLDAQFTRVPDGMGGWIGPVAQRRRRVFLVGHLGDPRRPAEVLLEREGVRWNLETSRGKRQSLAGTPEVDSGGSGADPF